VRDVSETKKKESEVFVMSDLNFAKMFSSAAESPGREKGLTIGDHVLAVNFVESKESRENGRFGRVQMVLLSSSDQTLSKGSTYGEVFFIEMGKDKKTHQGRLRQMIRAIAKLPDSATPEEIEAAWALLVDKVKQPGRGIVVKAQGIQRTSKTTGKPYVATSYESVPQTPAEIVEMRKWVEASMAGKTTDHNDEAPAQAQAPAGNFLAGLNIAR
jgi:hypothetical protein